MKKLITVILLLMSACTPSNSESILDNPVCDLPCWNNIIPGKTTEKDFMVIIEELPNVDQDSIVNVGKPWNTFDNRIYVSVGRNLDLETYVLDDLVVMMDFSGALSMSFGQFIERIGYPDNIITIGGHDGSISVIALYPEKGVGYASFVNDSDLDIQQSDDVYSLTIFDPQRFIDILDAGMFSNGFYNASQTQEMMYPWKGYGSINELYPLRTP